MNLVRGCSAMQISSFGEAQASVVQNLTDGEWRPADATTICGLSISGHGLCALNPAGKPATGEPRTLARPYSDFSDLIARRSTDAVRRDRPTYRLPGEVKRTSRFAKRFRFYFSPFLLFGREVRRFFGWASALSSFPLFLLRSLPLFPLAEPATPRTNHKTG